MVDPVSLADARRHLRLADDDTSDDPLLDIFLAAAKRSAEAVTGISLADNANPVADPGDVGVIAMAMLLTVAHWYANREAVTQDARSRPAELPLSASWLLGTIKKRPL